MKALVIGYGSIGKRHCEVLETLVQIDEICLVTSQDVADKICYKSLEEVSNLDKFDYFVIATPTFLQPFIKKIGKFCFFWCEKVLM